MNVYGVRTEIYGECDGDTGSIKAEHATSYQGLKILFLCPGGRVAHASGRAVLA